MDYYSFVALIYLPLTSREHSDRHSENYICKIECIRHLLEAESCVTKQALMNIDYFFITLVLQWDALLEI